MTDGDELRAAMEKMEGAPAAKIAQIEKFRLEVGWTKERLDAAFAELRRLRQANPYRSRSIEDWLKWVVDGNGT
jgi:hypothetical protein